jgi:hypothetical protein
VAVSFLPYPDHRAPLCPSRRRRCLHPQRDYPVSAAVALCRFSYLTHHRRAVWYNFDHCLTPRSFLFRCFLQGTGAYYPTSADSGGECGVSTYTRYPGPTQTVDAVSDWWAIEHGSALLVMLNSELEIGPGSDQYDFLSTTLSAINRNVTPWSIVMFHRVSGAVWEQKRHLRTLARF